MRKPRQSKHKEQTVLGASFRDPAGFVFSGRHGELLRQVNESGAADYDLLIQSGLYDNLVAKGWLVSHKEVGAKSAARPPAYQVIKPQRIPFVSYPFEWSFSQLQDAALLTLIIQKAALKHGMTLKDASAYNVQFLGGKPIFIDTLSFEKYKPGAPWQAYRQFCQHFVAPLALMSYTDSSLLQVLQAQLDGIRLDLAAKILPRRAKLKPGIAMHVVLHGRAQKAKENEHKRPSRQVTQNALLGIIASLERTVRSLKAPKGLTEWGDYYDKTNYSADAADQKAKLICEFVKPLKAATVLDLGGNNGQYSRVLNEIGMFTVCTDIDPNAVEVNYRLVKRNHETSMLPLLVDLTNPGGSLGWQNIEREPFHGRMRCDVVMSLALIHHLAISNNLPFSKIAEYFSLMGPYLVIEFVPKTDSQVQKLLSTRADIFPDYNETGFKQAFQEYYELLKSAKIPGTKRTLYLYKRKNDKAA